MNKFHSWALFVMTDPAEEIVAPAAIERALSVFEQFKERDHTTLVQARKALTEHIYGRISMGETNEQRLVVAGLAHLKELERRASE